MNAGATIPYHLRTSKMVDRSLFVELLRRLERIVRLDDYVYASMGGYPMADHHRVHRVLGLRRLFSFDENPETVRRQIFNKPIRECRCVELTTGEFVEDPDRAYREAGIANRTGQIVWLDYTRPRDLGQNIAEFVSLLGSCEHGDVVRITLNGNERALPGGSPDLSKVAVLEKRFEWLSEQVGQYIPEDAAPTDLTDVGFPKLLSRILRAAAADALGNDAVRPLSMVRYADGQQMFAASMIVEDKEVGEAFPLEKLKDWSLISRTWTEIHPLRIAALTPRERALIYRLIPSVRSEKLAKDLPFDPFEGALPPNQVSDHLTKYHDLLRFYPDIVVLD